MRDRKRDDQKLITQALHDRAMGIGAMTDRYPTPRPDPPRVATERDARWALIWNLVRVDGLDDAAIAAKVAELPDVGVDLPHALRVIRAQAAAAAASDLIWGPTFTIEPDEPIQSPLPFTENDE